MAHTDKDGRSVPIGDRLRLTLVLDPPIAHRSISESLKDYAVANCSICARRSCWEESGWISGSVLVHSLRFNLLLSRDLIVLHHRPDLPTVTIHNGESNGFGASPISKSACRTLFELAINGTVPRLDVPPTVWTLLSLCEGM